jgi:Ca2+-binding EF-hand superfamily protein
MCLINQEMEQVKLVKLRGYTLLHEILRNNIPFQHTGEDVSGEELHEILKEIDTNMNGQVELHEYLQVKDSHHF